LIELLPNAAKSNPGMQLARASRATAATETTARTASSVRIVVASAAAELRLITIAAAVVTDQLDDLRRHLRIAGTRRDDVDRQIVVAGEVVARELVVVVAQRDREVGAAVAIDIVIDAREPRRLGRRPERAVPQRIVRRDRGACEREPGLGAEERRLTLSRQPRAARRGD